jgi:hypothetical protein
MCESFVHLLKKKHVDRLSTAAAVCNRLVVFDVLIQRIAFWTAPPSRRRSIRFWPFNALLIKTRFNVFSVFSKIGSIGRIYLKSETDLLKLSVPDFDAQLSHRAQNKDHDAETTNVAKC